MKVNADTAVTFEPGEQFARQMDNNDPLAAFRRQFLIPVDDQRKDCIYLAGNSLGLQPKNASVYVQHELEDWARLAVEGHLHARHPWLPYHEFLTESTARLVGARTSEVVVMNTLTVNLHLMLVSFYRPTKNRFKILIEADAFPSDKYAVDSQARFHGLNPDAAVIQLKPRAGEDTLRHEDIIETIEREGDSIACILLGQVNYLTGQAFDMVAISQVAHGKGCLVGFNLAHGAGNLALSLHADDVDFAVWCGYKYLNGGPGTLSGCFINERHLNKKDIPRFEGWWGHNKQTRFDMNPSFDALPTAEAWQLSNPPIFQLAALRASLELFDQATMPRLRAKSEVLTDYLEYCLNNVPNNFVQIVTPRASSERGCQLSFRVKAASKQFLMRLMASGAICDFRQPDIIRAAPVPLYNSFSDVYRFAQAVTSCAET